MPAHAPPSPRDNILSFAPRESHLPSDYFTRRGLIRRMVFAIVAALTFGTATALTLLYVVTH